MKTNKKTIIEEITNAKIALTDEELQLKKMAIDYYGKFPRKTIDNLSFGLKPLWEYEMLKDLGAINENGVMADGYVVLDGSGNLLYQGRDSSVATQAKGESNSNTISRGSYWYSRWDEYKTKVNDYWKK